MRVYFRNVFLNIDIKFGCNYCLLFSFLLYFLVVLFTTSLFGLPKSPYFMMHITEPSWFFVQCSPHSSSKDLLKSEESFYSVKFCFFSNLYRARFSPNIGFFI